MKLWRYFKVVIKSRIASVFAWMLSIADIVNHVMNAIADFFSTNQHHNIYSYIIIQLNEDVILFLKLSTDGSLTVG